MNTLHSLSRRFREAHLDVELADKPLGARVPQRGLAEIVQLDIARPPRAPSERFVIFPGASDNRLDVLGIDTPRRQLVLFVQEAQRTFEVQVSKSATLPKGTRIVHETKFARTIEQVTGGEKRHFLCGMDEQHLFIAELPYGVSSVHGARESLRAPEVPPSLKSREGRVIRQGEWFFMPPTARDRLEVEAAVRAKLVQRSIGIAQAARLSRAGRPHVADEVVVLRNDGNSPKIFVRGEVRHPDHRTVTLREFHRTVPNRERFAQPAGVLWID